MNGAMSFGERSKELDQSEKQDLGKDSSSREDIGQSREDGDEENSGVLATKERGATTINATPKIPPPPK